MSKEISNSDIKLYTIAEVADILKITKRTVYTYVQTRKIKAIKLGKYWRVKKEDLDDFLAFGTGNCIII